MLLWRRPAHDANALNGAFLERPEKKVKRNSIKTYLRILFSYKNRFDASLFRLGGQMSAPLNLVGPQVRKFRNRKNWTQETLAAKLQVAGWDVSRESLAKLEAQFRRVPDCELLFLAKVLRVRVMDLFPARLDLRKLDPSLRLKVSTKHPRRKGRRR